MARPPTSTWFSYDFILFHMFFILFLHYFTWFLDVFIIKTIIIIITTIIIIIAIGFRGYRFVGRWFVACARLVVWLLARLAYLSRWLLLS